HGTVCVVGKIRDLILQLSKSSIYSTKPHCFCNQVLLLERRGVNKMISRIIRKILTKVVA
ncbi:hypothetical protein L6P49_27780, partial [Klebsiella pneumoniae]|nr:hypothetical protein [Klebsiella pneumoniae]